VAAIQDATCAPRRRAAAPPRRRAAARSPAAARCPMHAWTRVADGLRSCRWVFCPEEQCFAFDIHVHKRGECWLKQQGRFDALGKNVTAPKDPHEGHTRFPQSMRNSPREIWPWAVDRKIWPAGIPDEVPWISGVLAPADAIVRSAPADDRWRKRWCDKHSAQYGACDGPGAERGRPM
jgi:hypothetical protein